MGRRRDQSDWKERHKKKAVIPVPIRNEVITRDGAKCQYCNKQGEIENFHGRLRVYELWPGNHRVPFEIDHVIPESSGGETSLSNLKLACRKCNRSKKTKRIGGDCGGPKTND